MNAQTERRHLLPTRYARYGACCNIRDAYRRLPFQSFWTWITGKGVALPAQQYRAALRPANSTQVIAHLLLSWAVIALSILLGWSALESRAYLVLPLCWLLIVNRGRSLQATFHYMTHGAAMPNSLYAPGLATIFFTTPFFYVSWGRYGASHVQTHHHLRVLCSDDDPDQQFIVRQGFRRGMSETSFWLRVWLTPFKPAYLFHQLKEAIVESFIEPNAIEIIYRIFFWSAVFISVALTHHVVEFIFFLLIPGFIFFQHSLWLQLITEHLWFSSSPEGARTALGYGELTFGRFQGRALPASGALAWAVWILKLVIFDLPVRLYVYPQDLPNHDFHHRMPLVSYFCIADVRATLESDIGRFGPMYESWGFLSTLRMMRDRLCHNKTDSFTSLHLNQ